jgi:adenosine deaminase
LGLDDVIRRMPKVELHTHLLGSMRASTFAELAARRGIRLPADPLEIFANINSPARPNPIYARTRIPVPVSDPATEPNPSYPLLEVSRWAAPALVDAGDFARVAYEAFEDAVRSSNVRHCEMFFEPTLYFGHGVRYATIAEGVAEGARAAARDFGIGARMIAGINRAQPPALAEELVDAVIAHRRDEIVGIGLEDYELAGPPERFVGAYDKARRAGLRRTAHSSEHAPTAANTVTCLDLLGCERIDHGYFVLEDDAVVARCREQGVVFTCVFSTSRRSWRPWRRASVKAMVEAGLRVTLGADDPGMFPTTLTDEYLIAANVIGFDYPRIREFCLAGVDAAWIEPVARATMRADFEAALDALAAEFLSSPSDGDRR